jgi:hypothetical protein
MAILVITPEGDPVERALSGTATFAVVQAGRAVTTVAPPPTLTRGAVDTELAAAPGSDLLYFGHGQRAQLGAPIALVDGVNVAYLQGSVVLAMACSSAERLGPDAVQNGVRTWIGFTRPVLLPLGAGSAALAPWHAAPLAALGGASAAAVVKQTQDEFGRVADQMLAAGPSATPWTQVVTDSLVQRGIAATFRFDGDGSATI